MVGKGWFPEEIGGLDRYYRDLLEHLPDARAVLVGPAPGAPPRVCAVHSHEVSLIRRMRGLAAATRRVAPQIDIVDVHFALYGFWPLVAGGLRRKVLTVHFQGPWADENVAMGDVSRWRHLARWRLESFVYRRAAVVITLSSAFRQVAVERYGVSPWHIRVARPGVDLERFDLGDRGLARAELGLVEDMFVVVCVRRLVERMGIDVLLDAWEWMAAQSDRPCRLLVAGDGPLRDAMAARIEASPALTESVAMLGRVSEDRLTDLYRAADLNVVPTLAFEGFGLVVLEAAACGTASLVTDAGGLPEAVVGAPGSRVVSAGSAEALATALAEYVARPRGELRDWVEAYAWPRVAARHVRLYRDAAEPAADRPMRVVVLDHVAQLSGGEIALLRLLPHLKDVEPHVVLAEDGPLVGRLHRAGVSVQVLALGEASRALPKRAVSVRALPLRAAWDSAIYVLRLIRLLRRQRPDLVHANSLKSGLYGGLAARVAGIPLVWHLHDRLDPDYLPRSAVRLVRFAIRRLATEVIANSKSTAVTMRAGTSVTVVPSALPAALPPARQPTDDGHLAFAIVGRLTRWKGQHVFLEAFARAFPDGDHEAVIVGAPLFGEEEYARELEALAARLGIAGRVRFQGFQEDVWTELAAIDVLVHASVIPEPFGQVVQEGMAMGLPVIAADAGGPAEFVRNDVTGLLVRRDDPGALVVAMQRLAGDHELRRRLGQAARESCARFAPQLVATSVRGVYAAAAASRERRSADAAADARPRFGESRDDYCARMLPPGIRSVLDIGCGPGTGLLRLRGVVPERVGVDVDAAIIAIADEIDPTADHRLIDGASLPFADCSFDAAILSEVLEHVGHTNKVAVVNEALRVLRPGGRLLVTSPHRGPLWRLDPLDYKRSMKFLYALYRRVRPGSPDTPAEVGHVPLTLGEVQVLLQGRADVVGVGFGGPLYPLVAVGNAVLLAMGAPERWRQKYAWLQGVETSIRVPAPLAHSIRVVATKRPSESQTR